jgi:hypothetical protein
MTTINVSLLKEHADGSASYAFDLSEDMKDALLRFGIMKAIEAGLEASKELHPSFEGEPEQGQEPECPECKAVVLYECVACSNNNYPPRREWVGLTDDEIGEALMPVKVAGAGYYLRSARAIEAALKEKNT